MGNKFEYDAGKSLANFMKHGIDFEEAQALWLDRNLVTVPAHSDDEERWLAIGHIGEQIWAAVFTHREDRIRIISVRRARPEEVAIHEG